MNSSALRLPNFFGNLGKVVFTFGDFALSLFLNT